MAKFVMIVAASENGVIGDNNDLPWKRSLPRDMARFKRITQKIGTVLMGRKTAESLPKALPKRRNLVLSRSGYERDGFETFSSLEAVAQAVGNSVVAVIGGGEIYSLCAPYATQAYLTRVGAVCLGDTYLDVDAFKDYTLKGGLEQHPRDDKNAFPMTFMTLQNNAVQPLGAS
nr:Dihydrofolate reductase [uncultured bacterium]